MSEFVCKKPITLSGHSFSYGEVIPDGFVWPERALTLIRSNYITEIGNDAEVIVRDERGTPQMRIPVSTEKGILELTLDTETVVHLLTILQKNVEEAAKEIEKLEDQDALLLLHAIDSRKGVQKAAEERNAQLQEAVKIEK